MELDNSQKDSEYISAVEASKRSRYSSDYIGQLCREGRVVGKLVGRTWFVDLASLKSHRKKRRLGKPRKDRARLNKQSEPQVSVLEYSRENKPLMPIVRVVEIVEEMEEAHLVSRAGALLLGLIFLSSLSLALGNEIKMVRMESWYAEGEHWSESLSAAFLGLRIEAMGENNLYE